MISPQGENFTPYIVTYQDGATLSYALSVYNNGPFAVTILQVGHHLAPGDFSPLRETGVRFVPKDNDYLPEDAVPFQPFVIEPRHERYIVIDNRFEDCRPPSPSDNGSTTYWFTDVPVTYRVFGITRHTVVYPPFTLEVRAGNSGCPPNG